MFINSGYINLASQIQSNIMCLRLHLNTKLSQMSVSLVCAGSHQMARFWHPRKHRKILNIHIWCYLLPSGDVKIAIENGHWNSGFTHWKWWFSIVMLVYQRVCLHITAYRLEKLTSYDVQRVKAKRLPPWGPNFASTWRLKRSRCLVPTTDALQS